MRSLLARLGWGTAKEPVPLVVQTASPALVGADLAVTYFSGRAGGDFYDFVRVAPQRLLFGLLDVAGKREDNRPILQAAQQCFRNAGEELFRAPDLNEAEAMTELAQRLNREIMRVAEGVHSCPAFAGCYNEELGTVCYVNAGHTPALLQDGSGIVELPATGLPFGLFALATADAPIVGLEPRGSMVIVSRGAVEAQCRDEEFGLEGVKQALGSDGDSAQALSRHILQRVQDFVCAVPKHNDVTVLALVRRSTAGH